MALPKKLTRLIGTITPQTELEGQLLSTMVKRLENSLNTLNKRFGSDCGDDLYKQLISCALSDREKACFDQYEEYVERCVTSGLRRTFTEVEEMLVGAVVSQIVDITEALLLMGGVELMEEEEPEEEAGANP